MTEESIDRRQIDLLVDDELNSSERLRLIALCERNPEHWRQVALAYVESQTLRNELRDLVREPVVKPMQRRGSPWLVESRSPFWLAASVLLVLGLGYGLGMLWQAWPAGNGRTADVGSPTAIGATDNRPSVAEQPQVVQVTVANPNTNELRQIDVPIVQRSSAATDWRGQIPESVPSDLVRAMRELGHDVHQSRDYKLMHLRDGRRVLLPVDDIQVSFSGYQ